MTGTFSGLFARIRKLRRKGSDPRDEALILAGIEARAQQLRDMHPNDPRRGELLKQQRAATTDRLRRGA